jgi:hypothetical protein
MNPSSSIFEKYSKERERRPPFAPVIGWLAIAGYFVLACKYVGLGFAVLTVVVGSTVFAMMPIKKTGSSRDVESGGPSS